VEYGSDFWGHRYKKTSGICYRCHGKGYVHEETCSKCGGSGRYERTTWYD
jgi:DnaJ-class molecular chaperone